MKDEGLFLLVLVMFVAVDVGSSIEHGDFAGEHFTQKLMNLFQCYFSFKFCKHTYFFSPLSF